MSTKQPDRRPARSGCGPKPSACRRHLVKLRGLGGDRLQLATALTDYGRALSRHGRQHEPLPHLREALTVAEGARDDAEAGPVRPRGGPLPPLPCRHAALDRRLRRGAARGGCGGGMPRTARHPRPAALRRGDARMRCGAQRHRGGGRERPAPPLRAPTMATAALTARHRSWGHRVAHGCSGSQDASMQPGGLSLPCTTSPRGLPRRPDGDLAGLTIRHLPGAPQVGTPTVPARRRRAIELVTRS